MQGIHCIFSQSRGDPALGLLSSDPLSAPHPSAFPVRQLPSSVFSRLWGLLASCWVWLMDGREKLEYFSPSPLSTLVAVWCPLYGPRSQKDHWWPHLLLGDISPLSLKTAPSPFVPQPHPWGGGGASGFQLLLNISWLLSCPDLAFRLYYPARIKFPPLNLHLNP